MRQKTSVSMSMNVIQFLDYVFVVGALTHLDRIPVFATLVQDAIQQPMFAKTSMNVLNPDSLYVNMASVIILKVVIGARALHLDLNCHLMVLSVSGMLLVIASLKLIVMVYLPNVLPSTSVVVMVTAAGVIDRAVRYVH